MFSGLIYGNKEIYCLIVVGNSIAINLVLFFCAYSLLVKGDSGIFGLAGIRQKVEVHTCESLFLSVSFLAGKLSCHDLLVESGDIVNIDYVGKVDGQEFNGGSATGYHLTIGSGTFIDGFEDGLIGKNVGETVDLNLKFPDNYTNNTDLAGKDVVFTVTVNSISRVPELTDEVADSVVEGMTAGAVKG